jgi:hypothetical protein
MEKKELEKKEFDIEPSFFIILEEDIFVYLVNEKGGFKYFYCYKREN